MSVHPLSLYNWIHFSVCLALVLPKAEKLLKVSIQPYIGSILEALMDPTSRGFFEVRDVFFRELVDMSKNLLNDGTKEKLGEVTKPPHDIWLYFHC